MAAIALELVTEERKLWRMEDPWKRCMRAGCIPPTSFTRRCRRAAGCTTRFSSALPQPLLALRIINFHLTHNPHVYTVTYLPTLLTLYLDIYLYQPTFNSVFSGKPYLHASGSGSIAFTAPGGIFRLVLEEGESYTVSTRCVATAAHERVK